MGPNHYEILKLSPSSTKKEIKAQYYKLSLQYHPDTLKKNNQVEKRKDVHAKFVEISEAYKILSNETSRREYDRKMGVMNVRFVYAGNQRMQGMRWNKDENSQNRVYNTTSRPAGNGFRPDMKFSNGFYYTQQEPEMFKTPYKRTSSNETSSKTNTSKQYGKEEQEILNKKSDMEEVLGFYGSVFGSFVCVGIVGSIGLGLANLF
ncbi:hypothetical protein BB559_006119 [Furculomyces boomerangus]|uniref:J domain-containing protein n=2 Tax=Harpellales TaxID=61421 RepID=A0A2T9Y4M2_9FUNG|nr:hypothetical protein BB559_006398 [Furculomyces boomerangus]PVU87292.1 hypothetical protein BB559_006119 [Furculomyces boomerangus]PVZ96626.1 hypothetical protein BB558_007452 [Smittium angustum]